MDEALASISAAAKGIFDPYRPWTDPQAGILDRQNVYNFVMKRDWRTPPSLRTRRRLNRHHSSQTLEWDVPFACSSCVVECSYGTGLGLIEMISGCQGNTTPLQAHERMSS
jgi:hypothetical protein